MLTISQPYEKNFGAFKRAFFSINSDLHHDELVQFWKENSVTLEEPAPPIEDEKFEFPVTKFDSVSNLVYRFNMVLMGAALHADKREFLREFQIESIKAIIYATDYCPEEADINEYAGAVSKAYDEYGDSILFEERIANIAGVTTQTMGVINNQIALFKTLLTTPSEGI